MEGSIMPLAKFQSWSDSRSDAFVPNFIVSKRPRDRTPDIPWSENQTDRQANSRSLICSPSAELTRQGPSSQLLMLRRVPWPPESGCRKCRGPKKCLLNLKLPMSGFRSRPVYLKTSLTRNSFTQITGTPSKPGLKARGALTNLWSTKVQTFPFFCNKY